MKVSHDRHCRKVTGFDHIGHIKYRLVCLFQTGYKAMKDIHAHQSSNLFFSNPLSKASPVKMATLRRGDDGYYHHALRIRRHRGIILLHASRSIRPSQFCSICAPALPGIAASSGSSSIALAFCGALNPVRCAWTGSWQGISKNGSRHRVHSGSTTPAPEQQLDQRDCPFAMFSHF